MPKKNNPGCKCCTPSSSCPDAIPVDLHASGRVLNASSGTAPFSQTLFYDPPAAPFYWVTATIFYSASAAQGGRIFVGGDPCSPGFAGSLQCQLLLQCPDETGKFRLRCQWEACPTDPATFALGNANPQSETVYQNEAAVPPPYAPLNVTFSFTRGPMGGQTVTVTS